MHCNYVTAPALGIVCGNSAQAIIGSNGAADAYPRCPAHVPPTIVAITRNGWTFSIRVLFPDRAPTFDAVATATDAIGELVNNAYADVAADLCIVKDCGWSAKDGDYCREHGAIARRDAELIASRVMGYATPAQDARQGDHFAYPDVDEGE